MRSRRILVTRWVLLVLLTCLLAALGMGAAKPPDQQRAPDAFRRWMEAIESGDPQKTRDLMATLNIDYRMVDLSLAVREQVDFLLTPALLVQEAISEDVVLTYPEE